MTRRRLAGPLRACHSGAATHLARHTPRGAVWSVETVVWVAWWGWTASSSHIWLDALLRFVPGGRILAGRCPGLVFTARLSCLSAVEGEGCETAVPMNHDQIADFSHPGQWLIVDR